MVREGRDDVEVKGEESDEDEVEVLLLPLLLWPCSCVLGSSKMADEQETKADEKRLR